MEVNGEENEDGNSEEDGNLGGGGNLEEGGNVTSPLTQSNIPICTITNPHAISFVLQHFGFIPVSDSNNLNRRRVLCCLCLVDLPFSGNTRDLQCHFQRYHLDSMTACLRKLIPSPRTARHAARLPDLTGGPGRLIIRKASPKAQDQGNFYLWKMALTSIMRASVGERKNITPYSNTCSWSYTNSEQNIQPLQTWHWNCPTTQQQANHFIRSLLIHSLPVGTIASQSFQTFNKLLDPNVDLKTIGPYRTQLLHTLLQEEKKRIIHALNGVEYYSLNLDVWKSRDMDLCYLGVSCNFVNNNWLVDNRYLGTLEMNQVENFVDLLKKLHNLISEWKLPGQCVLTGSTTPENSELAPGLINNAIKALCIPQINCLAAALQHAANQALEIPAVQTALERVRALVSHIERNPELRLKVSNRLTEQDISPSSFLRSASFVEVYTVLQSLQAGRHTIQTVLTENREDTSILMPNQSENLALDSLQVVLEPLIAAAGTLMSDIHPSVSLVLPLVFKLTQISLAESADDLHLLAELKSVVRSALHNSYARNETHQLLLIAMYLDPRLKQMPFLNKKRKDFVQHLIRLNLTTLIKKQNDASLARSQPDGRFEAPSCKKQKLDETLAETFLSTPQGTECIAQSEMRSYENEAVVRLTEIQPLRWWKQREEKYKYLSQFARRVLCMSATSVSIQSFLTTEGRSWTERRNVLPPEDLDIIFLSQNYGGDGVGRN